MATEDDDDPLPEWAQSPVTTLDPVPELAGEDTPTAPHPVVAELAAKEAARAAERRDWYEEGQRDGILALRVLCTRRGLSDAETEALVLDFRKGLTPL